LEFSLGTGGAGENRVRVLVAGRDRDICGIVAHIGHEVTNPKVDITPSAGISRAMTVQRHHQHPQPGIVTPHAP
jgi:hypothetical protein